MAQVTVTIAQKQYRIACEDGQEEHLRRLAEEVDGKIDEMRRTFGEIGDNRLTVMAAITFVDEREDVKERLRRLEADVAALRDAHANAELRTRDDEDRVARAIVEAAERIEDLARRLAPTQAG
ncbi:cell division protein ZapA [Alsobacter sp. R-9]